MKGTSKPTTLCLVGTGGVARFDGRQFYHADLELYEGSTFPARLVRTGLEVWGRNAVDVQVVHCVAPELVSGRRRVTRSGVSVAGVDYTHPAMEARRGQMVNVLQTKDGRVEVRDYKSELICVASAQPGGAA